MLRRIAILTLLALVLACVGGAWAVLRYATDLFVAPGAADVRVAELAPGERAISYRMPNPADGWQTAIARRLDQTGWLPVTDYYAWGDTEKFKTVYRRDTTVWFLKLCERAELLGDRDAANIKVSYRFPCRP